MDSLMEAWGGREARRWTKERSDFAEGRVRNRGIYPNLIGRRLAGANAI